MDNRYCMIYSKNNKLIVRTNVSDLQDCPVDEKDLFAIVSSYESCPCGCDMETRIEYKFEELEQVGLKCESLKGA